MGYWYTELGPLNEVLHIWPYNDSNERAEIRQKVVDDGIWPPDAGDLITGQRSEIMIPTSFTEFTGEQEVGPVFEMRTYMYKPGEVNKTINAWSEFIEERRKYSPCIGAWYTDLGELNKFVHKLVEDGRVAIRNVRRDGIQSLQNFEKDGHVSEDVIKDNELEVQKITDEMIKKLNELQEEKEKEILEV